MKRNPKPFAPAHDAEDADDAADSGVRVRGAALRVRPVRRSAEPVIEALAARRGEHFDVDVDDVRDAFRRIGLEVEPSALVRLVVDPTGEGGMSRWEVRTDGQRFLFHRRSGSPPESA